MLKFMRGRLTAILITVFGVVLSSSLLLPPSPVKAVGTAIFEVHQDFRQEITRLDRDNLTIVAKVKMTEDGKLDETIATVTVKQTVQFLKTTDDYDLWVIKKVELSDLTKDPSYNADNSKLISPTRLDLRNRDNDQVAIIDYSHLPTDSPVAQPLPCYTVYHGTDEKSQLPRGQMWALNNTDGECTKSFPLYDDGKDTPVSTIATWPNLIPPKVQNYELDGSGGDSSNETKIKNWFRGASIPKLSIDIFETADNPPKITVPADADRSRPDIVFKLLHIGAEGSGWILWKNVDWLIFEAFEGTESIPNLYMAVSDSGNNQTNIVYDTDILGVNKGKFDPIVDGFELDNDQYEKLFGYLYYEVPTETSQENCGDEKTFKVGPSGADYKHYSEITGRTDQARELNGNCLITGKGWPQFWGVTVHSVPRVQLDCGIGNLFEGNVGKVFSNSLKCLLDDVFEPIVTAAQKWVNDAAGEDLGKNIREPTGFVFSAWQATRSLINLILIIALLAISFSNILRINIDTYAVKKALPNLVIGVILANASFLIIRYLLDISTVATNLFAVDLVDAGSFGGLVSEVSKRMVEMALGTLSDAGIVGILAPIVAFVAALITFVMLVWLTVLLYFRLVAIYLLTILAPLAFVAYGIPGMDKYFKQWWQQATKWVFIVPAMSAIFWLMSLIPTSNNYSIAQLFIMWLLFTTALTIPSKWGGSIIEKADKALRKGGQFAYGTSQSMAADVGLYGSNLSKKGGKFAKFNKIAGKSLKGVGGFVGAPSSIAMGYKVRQTGKGKAREFQHKQSELYKRFAGDDNRFMDAWGKQKEDFQGTSADTLKDEMRNLDDGGEIYRWLQSLRTSNPGEFNRLMTTPFNALLTTKKLEAMKELKGLGFKGDVEKLSKYLSTLKLFNTEDKRNIKPGNTGANAYIASGTPIGDIAEPEGSGSSTAEAIPVSLTSEHIRAIENGLKSGQSAHHVAQEVSAAFGLNQAELRPTAEALEMDIKLRPHIEHFINSGGPVVAREVAQLGADLGEEFDAALNKHTGGGFSQVIDKGRQFLEKAGYIAPMDVSDKDDREQAAELQGRVRLVTQGAHAVANGQTAQLAAQLTHGFNALGDQLGGMVAANKPEDQARYVQEDPGVSQVINNHIVQQARSAGKTLDAREVGAISQKLKEGLVLELTNKKTLSRIFGSEKFRQQMATTVGAAIELTASQPQATPTPPAPEASSPSTPAPPPAPEAPQPPPAPDIPAAAPVDSPDDTVL